MMDLSKWRPAIRLNPDGSQSQGFVLSAEAKAALLAETQAASGNQELESGADTETAPEDALRREMERQLELNPDENQTGGLLIRRSAPLDRPETGLTTELTEITENSGVPTIPMLSAIPLVSCPSLQIPFAPSG